MGAEPNNLGGGRGSGRKDVLVVIFLVIIFFFHRWQFIVSEYGCILCYVVQSTRQMATRQR